MGTSQNQIVEDMFCQNEITVLRTLTGGLNSWGAARVGDIVGYSAIYREHLACILDALGIILSSSFDEWRSRLEVTCSNSQ